MVFEVVEKFLSINGEGLKAGELAFFVRFKGCNLFCSYCDTSYANIPDAGEQEMTASEIVEAAKQSGAKNVTLTGGEPLDRDGISELIKELVSAGFEVEIETNGAISLIDKLNVILANDAVRKHVNITMDYKLPGSYMEDRMITDNFTCLRNGDVVKFVVSDTEDLDRMVYIINEYGLSGRCTLLVSPVFGRIMPSEIVTYMMENKLTSIKLQLQMHKLIWDPDKRGV